MKTVLILSGGMDSATLLAWALTRNHAIKALTFDYGSKHNQMEGEAADKIVVWANKHWPTLVKPVTRHITLGLSRMFEGASALLEGGADIPEGHYAAENMKQTVVPNRNMIMLSIAIGFAEAIGFERVLFGNHAGDHAIYPDCRPEFTAALDKASQLATLHKIKVVSPFSHMSKTNIARIGDRMGVPYELTYSCYKGGLVHCGACGTCVERREAFHKAKVKDPTEYAISWEESAKIGGLKT